MKGQSSPTAQAGGGAVGTGATAPAAQVVFRSTGIPQKDTLIRLMQTASVNFNETRMEDVMRWVLTTSGADIDFLWIDDRSGTGLDKDTPVTAKFENRTLLDIVEGVLERFGDPNNSGGGATWQMTESGAMQLGTRDRLNKFRRLEVYPIRDLLLEPPNFTNAYELDLQQALQQAGQGGGGGGQSPFRQGNQGEEPTKRPEGEKADEIIDILTQLVEPDQWQSNGGEAGSMRFFQGALLVNAPDYMHRGLNGYPYWPKEQTRVSHTNTRRYVSMSLDPGVNQLERLESQPVSGGG